MTETKRLGRGLEALLGPISREQAEAAGALRELPVTAIRPNPFQPRTTIDEAAFTELAASIEASGLLQPVVVRPRQGTYELIAGERRWRAVHHLGWTRIPAVVKDVDDQTLLTLALVENLQRDDLSPIDEAAGYQRLAAEFKVPHAEVARMVGRHRSTVANLLRLLQLPEEVQALVHQKALSEGHARALLALDDRDAWSRSPARPWPRDGRCARWRRRCGATSRWPPLPPRPPAARDRRRAPSTPTRAGSRTRSASTSAPTCGSPLGVAAGASSP